MVNVTFYEFFSKTYEILLNFIKLKHTPIVMIKRRNLNLR